jgi:biotin operon repressor
VGVVPTGTVGLRDDVLVVEVEAEHVAELEDLEAQIAEAGLVAARWPVAGNLRLVAYTGRQDPLVSGDARSHLERTVQRRHLGAVVRCLAMGDEVAPEGDDAEILLRVLQGTPPPGEGADQRPLTPELGRKLSALTGQRRNQDADGKPDAGSVEWAGIWILLAAGWTDDQIVNVMLDPKTPGLGWVATKATDATRKMRASDARSSVARARVSSARNPAVKTKEEAISLIEEWTARAEALPPSAFPRGSDKPVLLGVLRLAHRQGSINGIALSLDDLAPECGMNGDTVSASLSSLEHSGVLSPDRTRRTGVFDARVYTLHWGTFGTLYVPPLLLQAVHRMSGNRPYPDSGHAAFRHGALGKNGFEIVRCLGDGSCRGPKELAEVAGLSGDAVKRTLRNLREQGVVEHRESGSGYVLVLDTDWDAVAEATGGARRERRQNQRTTVRRATYGMDGIKSHARRLDRPDLAGNYVPYAKHEVVDLRTGAVISIQEAYRDMVRESGTVSPAEPECSPLDQLG